MGFGPLIENIKIQGDLDDAREITASDVEM